MPKTRQKKESEVAKLTDYLKRMKSVVIAGYAGLKVKDVTVLRKELKKEGVAYMATKKTLLKRALADAGVALDISGLKSGIALAFGFEDEVAPAKLLATFRKEHEQLALLGGMVGTATYSSEQVEALAKLPSRLELLAKIVGSLQAPLTGFVRVASGPQRGFVQVLSAKAQQ